MTLKPSAMSWAMLFGFFISADPSAQEYQSRGLEWVVTEPGEVMVRIDGDRRDGAAHPIDVFVPTDKWDFMTLSMNKEYVLAKNDQVISLMDFEKGRRLVDFRPERDERDECLTCRYVAFLPGDRRFVATGWDATNKEVTISVFSVDRPEPMQNRAVKLSELYSGIALRYKALAEADHGYTRFGEHGVFALTTSPDGNSILTGHDGVIAIWDIESLTIRKRVGCVGTAIAFSPDATLAACDSSYRRQEESDKRTDRSLRIIDIRTGAEVRALVGHTEPVYSASFSKDNKTIATGGYDGALRVWDLESGRTTRLIQVHGGGADYITNIGMLLANDLRVFLSPNARYALVEGVASHLALYDVTSGRLLWGSQTMTKLSGFSADGAYAFNGGELLESRTGKMLKSYNSQAVRGELFARLTPGELLYWTNDSVLRLDLALAQFVPLLQLPKPGHHLSPTLLGNKQTVIQGYQAGSELDISFIDLGDSSKRNIRIASKRTHKALWLGRDADIFGAEPTIEVDLKISQVSDDGKFVVTTSEDGVLTLWDGLSGEEIRSVQDGIRQKKAHLSRQLGDQCGLKTGAASSDGRVLVSAEYACYPMTSSAKQSRYVFSPLGSGLFQGRQDFVELHDPDARAPQAGFPQARIWDVKTGHVLATLPLAGTSIMSEPLFSPDNKLAAIRTKDAEKARWSVFSESGTVSNNITCSIDQPLRWAKSGRYLICKDRYIEPLSGEAIAGRPLEAADEEVPLSNIPNIDRVRVFFFAGDQWLILTPEGYYASSENGHRYVDMRRGKEVYGAEQLYDIFYRPDLVIRKLRGEDIRNDGKLLTIDQALANPPPVAEILALDPKGSGGEQEVHYRLQGKGGGIGEVRVFHNRKLVYRRDVQMAGEGSHEGTVRLQAVAGENEVTVMGMNQQNSVQGMMRSRSFTVAGEGRPPQAYVLAVGIGKYRSSQNNLTFAVSDAQRLAAALEKGLGSLYRPEDVHIELVADEQATREGLLERFAKLKAVVQPGDQFILFFASHGLLSDGKYYIVAHDYDGTFDPSKGLSSEEVMEASREISALHQLLIFDTCHAGGMDQTVTATYDARLSVLARQMGLHVFAAASSLQQAAEGYEGSGVFTHTLLEALSQGTTADTNQDGVVSVAEVGAYAKQRTEAIAQSFGNRQTPRIIDVGQDKGLYRFGPGTQVAAATNGVVPELGESATAGPGPTLPPSIMASPPPVEALVGHLQINVSTASEVLLDGQPVGDAAPSQPLNLPSVGVGEHRLSVSAAGYTPQSRSIRVDAGRSTQEALTLVPEPPARLEPKPGPQGLERLQVRQTSDGFVAVRASPGASSAEVRRIYPGMEVECGAPVGADAKARKKNWRHCPSLGGYVYATLLTPRAAPVDGRAYRVRATSDGFVAVRSKPSTSSGRRVTKLKAGDHVTCRQAVSGEPLAEGQAWLQCPSVGGWIYAPLLDAE